MEYLKTTTSSVICDMKTLGTTQLESTEPSASDHTTTWSCTTVRKKRSLIIGNMVKWIYKSQDLAKQ